MAEIQYAAPATVAAAVKALDAAKGKAKVLAGGTDLLVQLRAGRVNANTLVVRLGMNADDNLGGTLAVGAATLLRDNLHDHLGAAVSNIDGGGNYLEQAIFVDQLTEASARHLHQTSARAWRTAFRTVMREAQVRFDHDQIHEPAHARVHRARFGAYFYATEEPSPPPHNP